MSGAISSAHRPNYDPTKTQVQSLAQTPQGGLRTNSDPSPSMIAITPSDSTTYSPPLRAIYVGSDGLDVAVLGQDDTVAVTFTAVPIGTLLPVIVTKVMSTGTTATNLVGLR